MAKRKFNELAPVADYTPSAQRLRRERLTPEAIATHLRREGLARDNECYYRAIDLIRLTRYLRCPPGEREQLVDQILDELDEVEEERNVDEEGGHDRGRNKERRPCRRATAPTGTGPG